MERRESNDITKNKIVGYKKAGRKKIKEVYKKGKSFLGNKVKPVIKYIFRQ